MPLILLVIQVDQSRVVQALRQIHQQRTGESGIQAGIGEIDPAAGTQHRVQRKGRNFAHNVLAHESQPTIAAMLNHLRGQHIVTEAVAPVARPFG